MHVCALTRLHLMIVHMHSCTRCQLLFVHHLCIRFARPGQKQQEAVVYALLILGIRILILAVVLWGCICGVLPSGFKLPVRDSAITRLVLCVLCVFFSNTFVKPNIFNFYMFNDFLSGDYYFSLLTQCLSGVHSRHLYASFVNYIYCVKLIVLYVFPWIWEPVGQEHQEWFGLTWFNLYGSN